MGYSNPTLSSNLQNLKKGWGNIRVLLFTFVPQAVFAETRGLYFREYSGHVQLSTSIRHVRGVRLERVIAANDFYGRS